MPADGVAVPETRSMLSRAESEPTQRCEPGCSYGYASLEKSLRSFRVDFLRAQRSTATWEPGLLVLWTAFVPQSLHDGLRLINRVQ